MLLRVLSWFVFTLVCGGFAQAQTPYLDNRSTAAEMVRSLYDALNRHEFARAFGYFSIPPAKNFASYENGYAETGHVDVMIGDVSSEGAAGSIYYSVPTLVRATDLKGGKSYFSGCYAVRAVNASIQEPPFRPLQIERGALKSIQEDGFNTYSFPKCGPEPEQISVDATVDDAKALFVAELAHICGKVEETRGGINEPRTVKMSYRAEGATADETDRTITVFAFECSLAAYNATEVYYIADGVTAIHILSFAEPHLVITHPDGDDEGAKLKSMGVDGFTARVELVNSDIDENTQTITSFSKWRGIGDASSNGTWKLKNGEFVLTDYQVDPTYNGEIDPLDVIQNGLIKEFKN
jgi:hypothetical protein